MRSGLWIVAAGVALAACGSSEAPGPSGPADATDSSSACDASLPATLEAEDASLTGVRTASDVSGFSGRGYVTGFSDTGQEVTFHVCAPEAGYYTFELTYAKGTPGVGTRTLLVDGEAFAGHPMFPPQWSWRRWTTSARTSLHLDAGSHDLTVAFQGGDGGEIRLDALRMSEGPSPSGTSVRSVFQNDWSGLVAGWHAGKLYPKDDRHFAPRLSALHWKKDWPTNQIDEAAAYLRDDTGATAYGDPSTFFTNAYLTASDGEGYGELRVEYGPYGLQALPVSLTRRQIVPPNEGFVLVLYDLGNSTDGDRTLSLLEWADLHNKTGGPSEDPGDQAQVRQATGTLAAQWDPENHAWIVDMTETNDTVLVLGTLSQEDHHVAGEPNTGGPDRSSRTVEAFEKDPASLSDTPGHAATDVGVGLSKTFTLPTGGTAELAFFYGLAESVDAARSLAARIRSRSASAWADQSSQAWKGWLDSGKAGSVQPPVAAWKDALRVAMVTNRQSQQPEFGGFVASTNPAYFYSIWPRDASVTAMAFDAAGYLDQADAYWSWMAAAQADGSNPDYPQGTWWTNYGFWAKDDGIDFVHPEWDSLGLFLVGMYRHHQALEQADPGRARSFLDKYWPKIKATADFLKRGVDDASNHGFGPQDYSIWEENLAYNTFTQATYVAGLAAAAKLAEAHGEGSQGWGGASDTVRAAIFRDDSASPCPGLWNASKSYFIRSVKPDCTANEQLDASTDLLWVFGVLSAEHPRATQHRDAILANLTPGDWGYGIARYPGDEFYHSAPFSPGGQGEANASMPTWPQMSMYMTMLEHWTGKDATASDRLSWYVATTAWGLMPQGEAVDWTTQRPLVSTSSEPVTAAWFSLALLNQLGAFDPRLPPRDAWRQGGR